MMTVQHWNIYPILKDQYVDKGVTCDLDSVLSVLRGLFPNESVSIECDGLLVQIVMESWNGMDAVMKELQVLFPLLSFGVERVPEDGDLALQTWEY